MIVSNLRMMNLSHDSMEEYVEGVIWSFGLTANLLNHDIDLVTVLHVEVLGSVGLVESLAIEKESHVAHIQLSWYIITLCLWQ